MFTPGSRDRSRRDVRAALWATAAVAAMATFVVTAHAQTGGAPSGPAQTQGQPSPQGATGPLNTGSGGAPAESPQGETPPGMQAAPQGSGGGQKK
jgi:hypothetical protein